MIIVYILLGWIGLSVLLGLAFGKAIGRAQDRSDS